MKTQSLPVKLTEAEITAKGRVLAQTHKLRDEMILKGKASADDYKKLVREIEGDINQISDEIRTGKELREIEVVDQNDYHRGRVSTVRVDTQEEVCSRNMTAEERQTSFMDRPGDA